MPTSRARAATSRSKSSHSSNSPAPTTKLDSARNRPPKGVEPRAAALAAARRGTTRRPSGSGASREANSSRTPAGSMLPGGRCQAVVRPKRLPAMRRAVSSDTNAFGVVPWSFQ